MQKLKILNTREIKEISEKIKEQYSCDYDFSEYAVFMNRKNKIYLINKDIGNIKFDKLRIDALGLYFGEVNVGKVRFSIEGSQIIGEIAEKNVLELDDKQSRDWMSGIDLDVKTDMEGFVIVKNKEDFLGCGKVVDSKLLNYVPKTRRV
ncbi:hypothetical protein GF327_06800 [Candidatus Woesearchaeota archaeon]|nr:hypothetical protein [Candidatus Woesearchaeota archaeon]